MASETVFIVEESDEGGYEAKAVAHPSSPGPRCGHCSMKLPRDVEGKTSPISY